MTYVFVGTPEMLRAGRPFVVAEGTRVVYDGVREIEISLTRPGRFRTSKRGRKFSTDDGYEYTVHAWFEY